MVEDIIIQGFNHRGDLGLIPGLPPSPQAYKYNQQHRSGGAIPQAPGRLVGKSQRQPTRHQFDPVGRRATSEGSLFSDCGKQPRHRADPEGRQTKGRTEVRGKRRCGRVQASDRRESGINMEDPGAETTSMDTKQ